MKSIVLNFNELESYQEFLRNPDNVNKYGVYVWGFRFVDPKTAKTTKFMPYYVGRHELNIHRRIQEHVLGIRVGTHKILHKDTLRNSVSYRKVSQSNDPSEVVYAHEDHKRSRKVKEFPKRLLEPQKQAELLPHINFYIDNLYITYIHINHLGLNEKQRISFIHQLERYVQEKIGIDKLVSKLGDMYDDGFCPDIKTNIGTEHLITG